MKKLYSNLDLLEAMKQRSRLLAGFWLATALFSVGFIVCAVFYCLLPYNDPSGVYYIVGTSVLTGAYIVFCFLYMGISFKRSNAYCKALKYISVGLKEYAELPFEDIEDWTTRDGVDVNVAVFRVKNRKQDEAMLRRIYIDGEKEFPAFEVGKNVKMISQGNLLIEYETE